MHIFNIHIGSASDKNSLQTKFEYFLTLNKLYMLH